MGKYLASWLADSRRKKCTKIESEKKKPTKITTIIALEIISQDLVDHIVEIETGDVQICIFVQI